MMKIHRLLLILGTALFVGCILTPGNQLAVCAVAGALIGYGILEEFWP